ncbi:MAG: hypothetical protein LAO76_08555 [Acidobacteriia bacterium]|nr:hypothetical protein [Terriglobia bacterium]
MRLRLIVLLLLVPYAKGQQAMSHEEQVVRTTYARLSYAAQVNDIQTLWMEKGHRQQIDPIQFKLRMDQQLRFDLSDFKVGPISEILPVNYSQLVTKPSKQTEMLYIVSSLSGTSTKDQYGKILSEGSSAIAQVQWKPSFDIGENWDMSFATIYPLTEEAGQHQKYAAYQVKVTFQGRSRIYHAMFLFGPKDNPILPIDTVANLGGGGLTFFLKHDGYPGSLIEGEFAAKDPLVRNWLRSQQTAQGQPGQLNCDAATGRCSIHEDDFKKLKPIHFSAPKTKWQSGQYRLMEAGFHPPIKREQPLLLQATCSDYNTTFALPLGFLNGNQFHLGPEIHFVDVTKSTSCTFTASASSSGNCDTTCMVSAVPLADDGEGFLSSFCHQPGVNADTSHATATGFGTGASCSGAAGGAVKACFACACGVTVSISQSGVGATITSDGFFQFADGASNNCPAQPDPALAGGGGGGCAPPSDDFAPLECDPIILDLDGHGFELTSAASGVMFDIRATGKPIKIPWTSGASSTAFLVLDRNGNGAIDDGTELFSNVSPQPLDPSPNGFKALAQYDLPANGGNGDGVIDAKDQVFPFLRLWVDANHDGICQPGELHTLADMDVYSLSVDYTLSGRKDQFGNVFQYKASVNRGMRNASDVGPMAYDVFMVTK